MTVPLVLTSPAPSISVSGSNREDRRVELRRLLLRPLLLGQRDSHTAPIALELVRRSKTPRNAQTLDLEIERCSKRSHSSPFAALASRHDFGCPVCCPPGALVRRDPRAGAGTRTRDLRITNPLLYQLSYSGVRPMVGEARSNVFVESDGISRVGESLKKA
jgi:hypothetical protein